MDIIERLDNLRREFPTCSLAAFTDLSTGTILGASSQNPVPQERLDRLCLTAAEMLFGGSARRIAETLDTKDPDPFCFSLAIEHSELTLFLRSETETADALCCVCHPQVNLKEFLNSARKNLDAISAGE